MVLVYFNGIAGLFLTLKIFLKKVTFLTTDQHQKHYLTMIGAIVSIPFILTPALCMENENPARGQIISTMIFVTGIVTFIQSTWGCRLPLVQVYNGMTKKINSTYSHPTLLSVRVEQFLF